MKMTEDKEEVSMQITADAKEFNPHKAVMRINLAC